jgi:hypothetical protein
MMDPQTSFPCRGTAALFGADGAPFSVAGRHFLRIISDAGANMINMMTSSRRRWAAALIVIAVAATTLAQVVATRAGFEFEDEPILAFSTMRGNVPGVVINGNTAAGAPWVINDGDGVLSIDGDVNIIVRGLVFAPSVPNVGGTNPVHNFRAIVSCTTVTNGVQETVNITTGAFPADAHGNCLIHDEVTLPNPCYAPIVFVGPAPAGVVPDTEIPGGTWFAVTGN